MKKWFKHRYFKRTMLVLSALFLVWFFGFALPKEPFQVPYSRVMYSEDGYLLNAQVAKDQQWRFPAGTKLSPKFEKCILTFEDRSFYHHIGISPKGIGRAIVQNFKHGKVVSGGSTISMQTIRLMKQNPSRTWGEKMLEMLLAVRLELRYSKKEILNMYAMHAPFGNNVVGIEAASWRYFGKKTDDLSWAENALLAVLPNAPGLLYPGKNHDRLLLKRNHLLAQLLEEKVIDATTYNLAISEPIPDKPLPVPNLAWHYFSTAGSSNSIHYTDIQYRIQEQCLRIVRNYAQKNQGNQIQSIAVIVSDIHNGKILAYVGNTDKQWNPQTSFVDCAAAARSSGSVLKPFLYYESMKAGLIAPSSKLFDIPVSYNHFAPQNYARSYEGLISAKEALIKSLNIPMVGLLEEFGLQKFHAKLKQLGFKHLNRSSSNYGLSLILGSGEVTLQELNKVYNDWARNLLTKNSNTYDKACIYETLEAMTQLNRPDENGNWKAFINTQKIAWKTGTSFGNRDAWSVGISGDYVVTVWVGNADGSGRPNLTGIGYAAPILFDIYNALPKSYKWFAKPVTAYSNIAICKASGYKAGPYCNETDTVQLPKTCDQISICPSHHLLTVNQEETYRVNASIYDWRKIKQKSYFILPPVVVNYYKSWNPSFQVPPPWHPSIQDAAQHLKIIFPDQNTLLCFAATGTMEVHFKAMTETKNTTLYWHVDDQYIGSTSNIHELQYALPLGKHILSIIDESGNQQQTTFNISMAN
jgi:penicillin-binding protein 1C